MPALYDVSAHPMLTPKAVATGARLPAHNRLAELLLGLKTPIYTATQDVEDIALAVALQVNFQVEQGLDAFVASSVASTHSKQAIAYRDRYLNPHSVAIVAEVEARYPLVTVDVFDVFTSHRTRG